MFIPEFLDLKYPFFLHSMVNRVERCNALGVTSVSYTHLDVYKRQYEDRTFTFITKLPPVSAIIKKKLNLKAGSGVPNTTKVGSLSRVQLEEIAKEKMADLNANDLEAAIKIVSGTARSMGVEVNL